MDSISVSAVDGEALARQTKAKLEKLLRQKLSAVRKLVNATEQGHAAAVSITALNVSECSLAKRINSTNFALNENRHFDFAEVNTAISAVHVPTNIFDESIVIRNGITWSKVLDDTFVHNYDADGTLTWQYFCSTTGFLRFFPGAPWKTNTYNSELKLDTFDCRARNWYIHAAAFPKDVIILLDSSGSMKGLRSVVAKATVARLLDTLGSDDFVNVLTFSETVNYLDACFNATMVQATDAHKKRLKEALPAIEASNIADLGLALEWAFELLKSTNESRRGALCNKAIMIVTDGAGDTYERVFLENNWPQLEIRVFTYLIGREVRDTKNVLWMACRNKGKLSHFSSLADVHEHFQDYVHVLSRPLAIDRAIHPTWSDIYLDVVSPGLGLMTTVAQPALDIRTGKLNRQRILGIVGTDVPIEEILKTMPPSVLGVNGYAFAITSNGNVLFHPKLSSVQQYLEEMDSLLIDIANFEITDANSTLRNKMIDRKTETLRMKSVLTYENKMRAAVSEYNYYITEIEDTPFSLAIALPRSTGLFKLNGSKLLQEADALNFLTADDILAPWSYCDADVNETKLNPVEVLMIHLIRARSDEVFYEKYCDKELISGLLFDAEVTRNAIVNWRKADYDGDNETRSHRSGVELVFMGTKSGLTRYLYFNASIADRDFVHACRSTIEATYYTRAVLGGNGIFTFSVPFKDVKQQDNPVLVTASTPISINLEGVEAVGAVVGTQFRYSTFYEVFMNSTQTCDNHESWCLERTCSSPDVGCYLLDENGYVVLSKEDSEVGLFFGELEGKGAIMNELIIDEDDEEEAEDSGVYQRMLVTDHHSLCDIFTGTRSSSSSSFLIEPCRNILFCIKKIIHELFLFFVQFNLFNWLYSLSAQGYLDYNITDPRSSDDAFNYGILYDGIDRDDKALLPMMMECAYLMATIPSPSEQKREQVKNCFDNVKQQTLPRFVRRESCSKAWNYYMADTNQLPHDGTATSCKGTEYECANKFSVNRVPRTNLVLLVIDSRCNCALEPPVSARPFEVIHNKSYECQLLQREVYRKRPIACHAHSHQEDYSDCGLGDQLRPVFSLLLASSAFSRALHMLT